MFRSLKEKFNCHRRYLKSALISALTSVLVVVTVIPLGVQIGISAESKHFPVVDAFEITHMQITPENNTVINGIYHRVRDCTLLHTEWVLNRESRSTSIPIPRYSQYISDRDTGWHHFQNVTLFIKPDDFTSRVSGTSYYRCHPFWITRTTFYDARKNPNV